MCDRSPLGVRLERRDDEHAGLGDTRRLGLVDGHIAPDVHQPVRTESDGRRGRAPVCSRGTTAGIPSAWAAVIRAPTVSRPSAARSMPNVLPSSHTILIQSEP